MTRKGLSLLILGYIAVYLVPLGVRPMVVPDETRYAQMGREMVQSGDWIVPHLDGLRYFQKPIFGTWMHALSIRLCGSNAFAARLPSALAVGFTALLLGLWVGRFQGSALVALLCAAAFLTCSEVFVVGVTCLMDSLLALFVTASMVSFFWAWQGPRTGYRRLMYALFGVSCGLAFLTKGLLGFVIPGAAIVPFLIWQRRTGGLFRNLWIVFLSILATAGPWVFLIQRREPDFLHYFFWVEHIERFLSPNGGQHPEPFWFYVPVLLGGALPWAPLLGLAWSGRRSITVHQTFIHFTVCWLVFPFLFFSACGGKLTTYILPCFAPLAILLILGLQGYCATGQDMNFRKGMRNAVILTALAGAVLVGTQLWPRWGAIYESTETWKWLLACAGLLALGIGWWRCTKAEKFSLQMAHFFLALVAPLTLLPWLLPDSLKTRKMPGEFLRQQTRYLGPDTIILSDEVMTPAVCWFTDRRDVLLLGEKGELEYGLNYPDAANRFLPTDQFDAFQRQNPESHLTFVTRLRDYQEEYENKLSKPTCIKSSDGFLLISYVPMKKAEAVDGSSSTSLISRRKHSMNTD